MGPGVLALAISPRDTLLDQLKGALSRQGEKIRLVEAGTCLEAAPILHSLSVGVVFTMPRLPDGYWTDVLRLAASCGSAPVIVVARFPDMHLYLDAMEKGAADLVTPPFEESALRRALQCATESSMKHSSTWTPPMAVPDTLQGPAPRPAQGGLRGARIISFPQGRT